MKAVRVQYTVKEAYVEQNKSNIKAVMQSLSENPIPGMFYSTYQIEGTHSFMHINIAVDGETMNKLNDVEAFQKFRRELKASDPVSLPKGEPLNFIGKNWD